MNSGFLAASHNHKDNVWAGLESRCERAAADAGAAGTKVDVSTSGSKGPWGLGGKDIVPVFGTLPRRCTLLTAGNVDACRHYYGHSDSLRMQAMDGSGRISE